MDKCKLDALQAQIDKWGVGPTKNDKWWYTPVDFGNGLKTHRIGMSDKDFYVDPSYGLNKWNNYIKPFLPISLEGKTVVDIGCNCGLFCIQAVRAGAKRVVGIEGDPGDNGFYDQSQIVLDIMSEVDGVDYREKIEILHRSTDDNKGALWNRLPMADIMFAFNVFYWMERPQRAIESMYHGTEYLFVLGQEDNKRKHASLEDVSDLLTDKFNIIKQFIPEVPGGREFNATIARSVLYKGQ